MRKLLLICALLTISANSEAIDSEYNITTQTIMQHIEVLAHDSLEGREVGEPGELKAAEYIRSQFKSARLSSIGTDNYFQYYDFLKISNIKDTTEVLKIRDTAQNVIGIVEGQTDTTVIIGAHYDHLGWGTPASSYEGEPAIHNGADDNSSGVAALIELAYKYALAKVKPHYTMLFVAFSGEEAGLLGASNFAKNMPIDSSKIRMMINMDMIGRLKDQEKGLAILGVGSTDEFTKFFDSLNYDDIKLTLSKKGLGASDHTVFYTQEIPSLHIFTGAHMDYHKPSDDIEKIDAEGIVKVTKFVDTLLTYFDNLEKDLLFKKVKHSTDGKRKKKYSVTLGVIPDHVTEVQGFKIDGVMEDKPAEKAGMLKGDILIKLGEIVINDIYDYMNALSQFKKGNTVIAVVKRNDEQIELTVTF